MKLKRIVIGAGFSVALILICIGQTKGWTELRFTPSFSESSSGQKPVDVPGQTANEILQYQAGGHILGFMSEGVLIASGTHALKLEFINSNEIQPVPTGAEGYEKDIGLVTKEPPYLTEVNYPDLWKGITLKYEGKNKGVVKSTYELSPGADPNLIKLKSNVLVKVDQCGLLHYCFETGEMIESKPVAWQEINGRRVEVVAEYSVCEENEIGFLVKEYNKKYSLFIDPVLTWNTFLGRAESSNGMANSILIDSTGNIFISGSSNGTWGSPIAPFVGNYDAFVAKLDASGILLWNTFVGGLYEDKSSSVSIDGSGNVYVTGYSNGTWGSPIRPYNDDYDAFAAKLNSSGELQWNTFLGGIGREYGFGVSIEEAGDVFLVGQSNETWGNPIRPYNSDNDAFAVKLNSNGVMQWNTFLGGSGADKGSNLAIDGSGSVYVVGLSYETWGSPISPYMGNSDGFVAKINSAGAILWNTFIGGSGYDGVNGIIVDVSERAYLIGSSNATWGNPVRFHSGHEDAFAAKLDSDGVLQWNTFLGGSSDDRGNGIFVDGIGNIYLAGNSGETWGSPISTYNGEIGSSDAFAAKLDSDGVLQWNTFYGGEFRDYSNGITVDSSGNIYLVGLLGLRGYGDLMSTFRDSSAAYTTKLNSSGILQWDLILGGIGWDESRAIDIDTIGNVYVVGSSAGTWGNPIRSHSEYDDAFVAKLDSNGTLQWNIFLGGEGDDRGYGISVDELGYVYVSGVSCSSWGNPIIPYGGGEDAFAAKLDSFGTILWNTFLGGSGPDTGYSVSVDGAENVYVVGWCSESWGSPISPYSEYSDGFVAKLNSSGVLQWNTFVGGNGYDGAYAVAVDSSGNAYVTGYSDISWGNPVRLYSGDTNGFVAKLNSSGDLQWNTFLGGSSSFTQVRDVAVDTLGNVCLIGESGESWESPIRPFSGDVDAFVAKLNNSGILLWNTFIGGSSDDRGYGISLDSSGNIYLTGDSSGNWGNPTNPYGGGGDAFVSRLDSNGILQWNTFLWGIGWENGRGISLVSDGYVIVTGNSNTYWGSPIISPIGGGDAFVAKVSPESFKISSPNGGENWVVGSTQNIVWTTVGIIANIKLEYSTNNGISWTTIVDSISNENIFTWVVPAVTSSTCLVRISDAASGTPTDSSDAIFAIVAMPTITVTSPVGGESWTIGSNHNITWTTTGTVANVKLEYSTNSGVDWPEIIASTANTGTYPWTIPNLISTNCLVRVSEAGTGTPSDASDAVFTIIEPASLTVTYPNGGESWIGGTEHNIKWTTTGTVANVKLEYSINNGTDWTSINASTPNMNSHPWTLPNVVSSICLVRVSEASTGMPSDVSNAVFSIIAGPPVIGLSRTYFDFGAEQNGVLTPAGQSIVSNTGTGTLNWTATSSSGWLSATPGSGIGAGILNIGIADTSLAPGTYQGTVTVSDAAAMNSPQTITVNYQVYESGTNYLPFGSFDTPIDGSTVASSIPVTGWALDNIGLQSVKIYRGTGLSDRAYIGDAIFVEGARPDVEAAYPVYPQNSRAGWGYMMLTNFLPFGDGTYSLLAYATDLEGNEVLLGSKTITVDNLHAVRPFGAIDTPSQGGTVSGNAYINFGWALTPQPNIIPINGSTIWVWVDGISLAHPAYNYYRGDIATQFPGYANSNGAVGLYYLNTTNYADGVHTIAWSVADSGGNTDGIGSRYFSIQNLPGASSPGSAVGLASRSVEEIAGIPEDAQTPVFIRQGISANAPAEMVFPETDGSIRITIPEVTRVAVYMNESDAVETEAGMVERGVRILNKSVPANARYEAYQLVLGELRQLPIGASFDPHDGVLYWQPGPGFLGEYGFVFIDRSQNMKKSLIIKIGQN